MPRAVPSRCSLTPPGLCPLRTPKLQRLLKANAIANEGKSPVLSIIIVIGLLVAAFVGVSLYFDRKQQAAAAAKRAGKPPKKFSAKKAKREAMTGRLPTPE